MNNLLATIKKLEARIAKLEAAQRAGNGETWTLANVATDRTLDANSTTLAEVADVLGTLITDLSQGKQPKV